MKLVVGGLVVRFSRDAYSEGGQELLRARRARGLPGILQLAEVWVGELAIQDSWARLPLRWEITGPGDERFPVLDADLTLAAAREYTTVVALSGAYRPPPSLAVAGLDQEVIRRCAARTTRGFLAPLACALAHPAGQARPAHGQRR